MTLPPDPPRLRDDPAAPPDVRDLLASARPTTAPDLTRAAALRARVAEIGSGSPSMAPGPATGGGSPAPVVWSGAVALAAAVVTGAVVALLPGTESAPPGSPGGRAQPAPTVFRPTPPRPDLPAAPAVPASAEGSDPALSDAPATVDPRPAGPPAVEPTAPRRRASQRPTDDLAAEQRLLEAARRALDGSPAAALASLEQHGVVFPNGQLAAEREYLAIRALGRLGRHAEADDRRAAFLDAFPTSPYAQLLRRASSRD